MEDAPKTAGRRFAMLQAVLQPGMGGNPAKFEEAWNAWEHQVDVNEKLATSKLDDDVKISVVLREAPTTLRYNLLGNSQQSESNCKKLRAIIQAYLNHVVDAKKRILIVSYFCENGIETPLARQPLLQSWRNTRAIDQEELCVLREGADGS